MRLFVCLRGGVIIERGRRPLSLRTLLFEQGMDYAILIIGVAAEEKQRAKPWMSRGWQGENRYHGEGTVVR